MVQQNTVDQEPVDGDGAKSFETIFLWAFVVLVGIVAIFLLGTHWHEADVWVRASFSAIGR